MTDTTKMNEILLEESTDRETDPLALEEPKIRQLSQKGVDYFELFINEVVKSSSPAERTITKYETTFKQWRVFMENQGRHPAAPNEQHVLDFIKWRRDYVGTQKGTVKRKVNRLQYAYEYWVSESKFTTHEPGFTPFETALAKSDLEAHQKKPPHGISVRTLREIVQGISRIEWRGIIALQLKLGLRASELANIELRDVSLGNDDMKSYYSNLGSHPYIDGRDNCIYIPPRQDEKLPVSGRKHNKSWRPRILPLDDDCHRVLRQYLFIRPDADYDNVFINRRFNEPFGNDAINYRWKETFHPEYAETERNRPVTSHFGRHYFTTHFRSEKNIDRDLVKYMRGDLVGETEEGQKMNEPIDHYIHTRYEHILDEYLNNIYSFDL